MSSMTNALISTLRNTRDLTMKSTDDRMVIPEEGMKMPATNKRAGKICVNEWCDKPLYSLKNGYCHNCYEKNRRGTLVDPRTVVTPVCAFEGCGRKRATKGYCRSHYMQLWRGEELRVLDGWKVEDRGDDRKCTTCQQWKNREAEYYNTTRGTKQGECKQCMIKRSAASQQRRKLEKAGVHV